MNIKNYLDATYLKTAAQAQLSEEENAQHITAFIQEAIAEEYKLVMLRPEWVSLAKQLIAAVNSKVTIGTVIDFPLGQSSLEAKLAEAQLAIENGADDLDFVCNYEAFKHGNLDLVKKEILACTQLGLDHHKIVKWIIEVAALQPKQIVQLTTLIKNCVIANFKEHCYNQVFIKSSTGFYVTPANEPNGATQEAIILMLENGFPLPIKAAGGVRNYEEAVAMIRLGVKRIGTSAAKQIAHGEAHESAY